MRKQSRTILSVLLVLSILIIILTWRVWQTLRQAGLNQALIAAVKKQQAEDVRSLLNRGADANARDHGEPPLSEWQYFIRLFRARANTQGPGTPVLSLTASTFDAKTARLLLSRGAHVDAVDPEGKTPLVAAIDSVFYHYDMGGDYYFPPYLTYLRLLADSGADVNARDPGVGSLLMRAAQVGDEEMARILLAKGAHVDGIGGLDEEWTPLMAAAGGGHTDMVKLLINAHVDVNHKTRDGSTALTYAKAASDKQEQHRILQMLRKAGARE